MRLPIQFALSYPDRLETGLPMLDLLQINKLTFEKPDTENFRNLALAFEVMNRGGNMPCILNAANEMAVEAFLQNRIGFLDIPEVIEQSMKQTSFIQNPGLDDYTETDRIVREKAQEFINTIR